MARDSETHREALEEARRSASERESALEAELQTKQQKCEALEGSLTSAREDAEAKAVEREQEGRRAEASQNDLRARGDAAVERAEAAEGVAKSLEAEGEALRKQISELENKQSETEARANAAEDNVQRLEAEGARASAAAEDELANLRRQLDDAHGEGRRLEASLREEQEAAQRAAAERREAQRAAEEKQAAADEKQAREKQQMAEQMAMAQEELLCRQVDSAQAAFERQRLSGALEESRRALRNSFGVVRPAVASADSAARISRLEALLAEEKRKGEDQARALERTQQQSRELASSQTAGSDARVLEAERRCASMEADLRKAQAAQSEAEERVKLSLEEISSLRRESTMEQAQLRGALDQLRSMLKVQTTHPNGGGGYPSPLGTM